MVRYFQAVMYFEKHIPLFEGTVLAHYDCSSIQELRKVVINCSVV